MPELQVEHRDGSDEFKLAPLRKTIYSLGDLRRLLVAANRRYLEFISAIEDPTVGTEILDKISEPLRDDERTYKGFNFFNADDRMRRVCIDCHLCHRSISSPMYLI